MGFSIQQVAVLIPIFIINVVALLAILIDFLPDQLVSLLF